MINEMKKIMLKDKNKIIKYIEYFGFCHITIKSNYISFARSHDSSPKSIVIYLKDNENLLVKDFPKNVVKDIFAYISLERCIEYKEVIRVAKNIFGIDNSYLYKSTVQKPFGGLYSDIKIKEELSYDILDEEVLEEYKNNGNRMFLRDGIDLRTQKYFNISFSPKDQAICIPIYSPIGDLIGIKGRINKEADENEQKYFYIHPCAMSYTLYGYSHNYVYLESSEIIYVAESEKTVMAAHSYGIRNIVALGSSSISHKQIKLLLSLRVEKIVLLHDNGFMKKGIIRNAEMIKNFSRMRDIRVYFWNYFKYEYKGKISPTDLGKEKFLYILKNEIEDIKQIVER